MTSFNPAISNYILKCTPEAQTILIELRAIVHSFCPEVTETIKWSFPHFEYKGAILCSMAGFKHHSSFGFWLANQLNDSHGVFRREEQDLPGECRQAPEAGVEIAVARMSSAARQSSSRLIP